MEVGQGPNVGCSAKGGKKTNSLEYNHYNTGRVSIPNAIGSIRTVQPFHLVKWKYMYQNLNEVLSFNFINEMPVMNIM
jgi:hypothetical protein